MHQPATPLKGQDAVTSPGDRAELRKFVRMIVSLIVVISAVIVTLYVWGIIERHPRTDDRLLQPEGPHDPRVGSRRLSDLKVGRVDACQFW